MNHISENETGWRLTSEEVRAVKGFENATDEDVENIIDTLALLGLAFYEANIMEQRNDYSSK